MFLCDQNEIDAVANVLKSKKLFRYQGAGVKTECSLFESEFSHYLKISNSIMVTSGTNALVTGLFINGIGPGDEVLVPSYTFFGAIAAVIELGAIPIIVNINHAFELNLTEAAGKITSKTKAIMIAHLDGEPANMDLVLDFISSNKLILIEDVAQAIGGSFKNKKIGTFGDAGCFSFNVDKIISCGEGGAITLNSDELFQKAMMYHDTCNQFGPTNKEMYTIEPFIGRSMRCSEIQGAIIRVQLRKLDEIISKLSDRKKILEKKLSDLGYIFFITNKDAQSCSTTIRIILNNPNDVKNTIIKLGEAGFKSTTPLMRPGHNVWQWLPLLKKVGKYNRAEFLQTIDILSSVVIVYISLDESDSEWNSKVTRISN